MERVRNERRKKRKGTEKEKEEGKRDVKKVMWKGVKKWRLRN